MNHIKRIERQLVLDYNREYHVNEHELEDEFESGEIYTYTSKRQINRLVDIVKKDIEEQMGNSLLGSYLKHEQD